MLDSIMRRFPPGLADLSEFLLLDAYQHERDDGNKAHLHASASFMRVTEPTDPAGRGFRQNEWAVNYTLCGPDIVNLELGVETAGTRRYSLPFTSLAKDAGLTEQQITEGFILDDFADRRTTRLRLPRGFVQPQATTKEIDDVITVVHATYKMAQDKDARG